MPRLIDKEKSQRTQPMQVICLGMCRTGTMGLYWGLNALGFRTYHMMETMLNGARDTSLFYEAYRAKYDEGRPYGREDFDRWYGQYNAVADIPAALFVEELYAAYPDAKFILTDRDPDAWVRSMHKTVFAFGLDRSMAVLGLFDRRAIRPIYLMCYKMAHDLCGYPDNERIKQYYIDHVARVKATVPAEKLLYLRIEEGITWEKLCPFLGVPIPDEPMPDGAKNGPDHFQSVAEDFTKRALINLMQRTLVYSAVPMLAMGIVYFRQRSSALRLPW